MAAPLVKLDDVKLRLGVNFHTHDTLITAMIIEATDIVIDYIMKPDHGWTIETVPGRISSAILLVIARLYARDDEPVLTDAVKSILRRDRKPVVA